MPPIRTFTELSRQLFLAELSAGLEPSSSAVKAIDISSCSSYGVEALEERRLETLKQIYCVGSHYPFACWKREELVT